MQPSRRAFLTAGRALASPWGRFYQRLARSVHGRLEDRTATPAEPGRAWLQPARAADVHHARALCAEAGVTLALQNHAPAPTMPCLLLDPSALDGMTQLPDGRIDAEPGVRVADLRQRLHGACPGAPDDATLADWLASAAAAAPPPGALAGSGVHAVEVLLADGTLENFGPFGAQSNRPALSVAASRLVSELFTLATQPAPTKWRHLPAWPAQYRLDALLAEPPNLAHLLLGSGGTLAWLERARLVPVEAASAARPADAPARPDAATSMAADMLDAEVKQRFDPRSVFPYPGTAVV